MAERRDHRRSAALMLLLLLPLAFMSCSRRYHSMATAGKGMEKYAEERYAHGMRYMEQGRFELAKQQFAIVERTAISPDLRELAHQGHDKATAIIEAKR